MQWANEMPKNRASAGLADAVSQTRRIHALGKATLEQTFLSLLTPLQDGLYRFASRSAWRKDMAGDIVQEAILTAWREYGRFTQGTNFRAWMYKILTNTVYTHNKRVGYHRRMVSIEAGAELEGVLERESAWSTILEDPERVLESLDDRLVRALDRLSPDERQCLLLRLLEGFSYKEISSMLDVPMGTVMSHVHRARMKLREQLAAYAVEEGLVKESSV